MIGIVGSLASGRRWREEGDRESMKSNEDERTRESAGERIEFIMIEVMVVVVIVQ